MNAVFGGFYRTGGDRSSAVLKALQAVSKCGIENKCIFWKGDRVILGQTLKNSSSNAQENDCSRKSTDKTITFISAGRLDNADEICSLLSIPISESNKMSDEEVMQRAYSAWGRGCSARIFGDWVFAAWHSVDRQLVLSCSHHGNLALYYYIDANIFVFSTSRQALLALQLAPPELDELYLGQYIISWSAYYGERTLHKSIRCLPSAHTLIATPDHCDSDRYWFPENISEVCLFRREEYVETFLAVFDEAVKCRLRSDKPIAASLSGGLDSGSVATSAASLLAAKGQRLKAFTSIPYYNTKRYDQRTFDNELPYAMATAQYSKNIDLHPVESMEISPIGAIRRVLELGFLPCHGSSNLYWLLGIQQAAKGSGCNVLLTGAEGNGGVSWPGDTFSQPFSFLITHFTWRKLINRYSNRFKQRVKLALPIGLWAAAQYRRMEHQNWYRQSAIHPDFARRIQLLERRLHDPCELPALNPREQRLRIIMPGRSLAGPYEAELGAVHGLDIRDPTADARVLAFTLSIPDHVFMDPKTGIDRWLIREAMKGRLPDEVRLNRTRGSQSGDLLPRLRACAGEVECALNELAQGPAAAYVDVVYMRQVWLMIQSEDTYEALKKAITVLTRGIMAGLFVNQFYE